MDIVLDLAKRDRSKINGADDFHTEIDRRALTACEPKTVSSNK
jgi:hypothetical protein